MDIGDWLTRGTIWLALVLYVASELAGGWRRNGTARKLNTFGCAAFLAHIAAAFHFQHHWSHADAYAETARKSAQMTGWNSGIGLYINYLFALVCLIEVIWMHANLVRYCQRAAWINWLVRGFFFFIIFNGAFVFVKNPLRWFGLLLCLTLLLGWSMMRKRKVDLPGLTKSS